MGMGRICNACKQEISRSILDNNYSICPHCGNYLRFHAKKRILSLADKKSFSEWDADLKLSDPLNDFEYEQKLLNMSKKHNLNDAIITGEMRMDGISVAIGVMDTRFMLASMGYVVGEKVTRLFERAKKKKLPVIMFCCSGGARMQEGIISLLQMEKTVAAVRMHGEADLLFVSVLTNPTMGGVTASFATQADIVVAEKGAKIGFAGARVIEQNTGDVLPDNFQTAEFQLSHGFIDDIVEREHLRDYLSKILTAHSKKSKKMVGFKHKFDVDSPGEVLIKQDAWQTVRKARSANRPTSLDYIERIFDDFIEFHGDRVLEDDHAVVGGVARLYGKTVTVIGHQKGKKSIDEAKYRNWGMAAPSGYRKALRLMKQAEKFNRPIIFFVDTIGAACGIEAEKQGQGYVIAQLLNEVSGMGVPILSIIHGEAGSGGALAFAVANEIWMLENAVYSVLTPEGYASILWRNNDRADIAAEKMKLTSVDLKHSGVVDKIFPEPENFSAANLDELCSHLRDNITLFCEKYSSKKRKNIIESRNSKFRDF